MQESFHRSTFTLIEMLVIVVVIGILAGVLVPRLVGARERASDAGRVVKVGQVSTAIELYAEENGGNYPTTDLTNGSTVEMVADKIGSYLTTIPNDPGKGVAATYSTDCLITGDSFAYYSDGTMYAITALMESKKGNTSNCLGVIDSDKQAGFQVVGKGLTYNINFAGGTPLYDPDEDGDATSWCEANLTQQEVNVLNQFGQRGEPTTYTIADRCALDDMALYNMSYIPTGLKKLVNLTYLEIGGNGENPKSIDLSNNTQLTNLQIHDANISSINLSNNTQLTYLEIYDANISSIDLSNNTQLHALGIYDTNISSIDLSINTNLEELHLPDNMLTSITLPSAPQLYYFNISNNQLSSLPPEICSFLQTRGWYSPSQSDPYEDEDDYGFLDSGNPEEYLCGESLAPPPSCESLLTDSDLAELNALGYYDEWRNKIVNGTKESWCNDKITIDWYSKSLTTLPSAISKLDNPKITHLYFTNNQLSTLPDLSKLSNVTYLDLHGNNFSSLPDPQMLPPNTQQLLIFYNNFTSPYPDVSNYRNKRGDLIEVIFESNWE